MGEDLSREGLKDTPERAAKAMQFLTRGYTQNLESIVNGAVFSNESKEPNEIILVKNIEFFSVCEHHILPFIGECHVAYIPNGKVLGLSKIARIVDLYARRLQIQEQLTQQIAAAIMQVTDCKGVAVVMKAKHLCIMMRGVEKQNSEVTTSVSLGSFQTDPILAARFFSLLNS